MDVFHRLKEGVNDISRAADLAGLAAAGGGNDSSGGRSGGDLLFPEQAWDATTPRGQLEGILTTTASHLRKASQLYDNLKTECEALRREHGEYRAKVQAWRAQAATDRDNSKKMILALQGCGEGEKGATYTQALEEQVSQMKDSLRQATEKAEKQKLEKELSDVKWQEKFDEYRLKLENWNAVSSGAASQRRATLETDSELLETPNASSAGAGDGGAGGGGGGGGGGGSDNPSLLLIQKDQEIDLLSTKLARLEELKRDLEEKVEEQRTKNMESAKQLQDVIEGHNKELSSDQQARHIKDLETELKMWRDQGRRDQKQQEQQEIQDAEDSSAEAGEGGESSSPLRPDTPASPQRESAPGAEGGSVRKRLDAANALVAELRAECSMLKAKTATTDTDAGAREAALQELYDENLHLRRSMSKYVQQGEDAEKLARQKEKIIAQHSEIAEYLETKVATNQAEVARVQKTVVNLQRELSNRNETVVKLRGEVASHKAPPLLKDSGVPRKALQQDVWPSRVGKPGGSSADATPLLPTENFTWRKLRIPLAVSFIALFLVFSFVNSRQIAQDTDMSEKLANCMKIAQLQKNDPKSSS